MFKVLYRCNRTIESHTKSPLNTGDSRAREEIALVVEQVLSDRPGEWRVSIVGSRENDNWELKIEGPKGFERAYTLIGGAYSAGCFHGHGQPAFLSALYSQPCMQ